MTFDLKQARAFVAAAALPGRPAGVAEQDSTAVFFESTKPQTVVVKATQTVKAGSCP